MPRVRLAEANRLKAFKDEYYRVKKLVAKQAPEVSVLKDLVARR